MNKHLLRKKLIASAKNGNLMSVQSALRKGADIHADGDSALVEACSRGHLNVAQYLLFSPEIKEHADIHAKNEASLRMACYNGHFEMVKFLLTSEQIKDKPRLDAYGYAFIVNSIEMGYMEIYRYILKNEDIYNIYKEHIDVIKNSTYFLVKAYNHAHKSEQNKNILEFCCLNTTNTKDWAEIIMKFEEPYKSFCMTVMEKGNLYHQLQNHICAEQVEIKKKQKI